MGNAQMIVLDTHVLLWWVSNPELLSKKARSTIEKTISEGSIYISSISTWEIAVLVDKKRLALTMDVKDWITRCEAIPYIKFVPVTNGIAIKAVQLTGDIHNDPADRIIVATALSMGVALVTMDQKLRNYQYVKTVW